jgi:hypothetical protein
MIQDPVLYDRTLAVFDCTPCALEDRYRCSSALEEDAPDAAPSLNGDIADRGL